MSMTMNISRNQTTRSPPEQLHFLFGINIGVQVQDFRINISVPLTSIGLGAFEDWTSSQTIYIKGRSEAPTGWSDYWEYSCDAQIVWNA